MGVPRGQGARALCNLSQGWDPFGDKVSSAGGSNCTDFSPALQSVPALVCRPFTCLRLQVEPGETPERALVRELHEELGIEVSRITGNKCRWEAGHTRSRVQERQLRGAGGLLGIAERVGLGVSCLLC